MVSSHLSKIPWFLLAYLTWDFGISLSLSGINSFLRNSFSVHVCMLSHLSSVQLFAILWTVAHQAPLSMGFSRQDYWSGLPCPPPGYLPDPRIEPSSLTSAALAGRFFTASTTWETHSFSTEV